MAKAGKDAGARAGGPDRRRGESANRGEDELTLGRCWTGGRQGTPQRRRRDPKAWTDEDKARFIEALEETCNISEAARQAGHHRSSAYDQRDRDPEFRAAWEKALLRGYETLETKLLERAIHGTPKTIFRGAERIEVREFHDGHAIALLKLHRENVMRLREREGARDPEGAFEEIMRRLAEIRARTRAEEAAEEKEAEREDSG